jgi:probable rRNA maturation factor
MKSLEVPATIETDCAMLGGEAEILSKVRQAVIAAAQSQGFSCGSLGVLITDDETIREINREHLSHDYETDVISFAYEQHESHVEGELVASVTTAVREANAMSRSALDELLLYIVHGTLHICGLDDQTAESRKQMRLAERQVLESIGIVNAADFDPDLLNLS